MNTLDELFLKAKNLANAAGNKAQEVAELAKLRLQATQLRSDLDSNYLKLGEIIYELRQAGTQNDELIEMCVAEIEAQIQELEELNNKINEMRNVIKCPACMNDNPVGALFCSRCGAALTTQPKSDVIVCETVHMKDEETCDCGCKDKDECDCGCKGGNADEAKETCCKDGETCTCTDETAKPE